jgi:hypothetical protein
LGRGGGRGWRMGRCHGCRDGPRITGCSLRRSTGARQHAGEGGTNNKENQEPRNGNKTPFQERPPAFFRCRQVPAVRFRRGCGNGGWSFRDGRAPGRDRRVRALRERLRRTAGRHGNCRHRLRGVRNGGGGTAERSPALIAEPGLFIDTGSTAGRTPLAALHGRSCRCCRERWHRTQRSTAPVTKGRLRIGNRCPACRAPLLCRDPGRQPVPAPVAEECLRVSIDHSAVRALVPRSFRGR